jgi:hypothetical protein
MATVVKVAESLVRLAGVGGHCVQTYSCHGFAGTFDADATAIASSCGRLIDIELRSLSIMANEAGLINISDVL